MNTTIPDHPDTELATILDRLSAAQHRRTEWITAQIDALPASKPCPAHPAITATLDTTATRQRLSEDGTTAAALYTCPQCIQDARAHRFLHQQTTAGIPRDVQHATLANFDLNRPPLPGGRSPHTPREFLEAAHAVLTRAARNLILGGTPGIGKGHLAAAIANQRLREGYGVKWDRLHNVFIAYHSAYAHDRTAAVIRHYVSAHLLILDEVGLQPLPADGEAILWEIIDGRHQKQRQTILLTNLDGPGFQRTVGNRITDRLREGKRHALYGTWQSSRGIDNASA